MARPREPRSPSPAGNRSGPRSRKYDDRYERDRYRDNRDRRDDGRGYRHRSRSRPGENRQRDRQWDDERDRLRDRDRDRDRDREPHDRDRHYRRDDRDRDRRRSRDRPSNRSNSPNRRQDRSRDNDRDRRRRDDSRDRVRGRLEGTADSRPRSSARDDSHHQKTPLSSNGAPPEDPQKSKPPPAEKSAADKQAERRAKMEAWKKKKEIDAQKQEGVNPTQTRNLLAEMDRKATESRTASPGLSTVASPLPAESGSASPAAAQYVGKFDPKAIAKKSSAAKSNEKSLLGAPLELQKGKLLAPQKQSLVASALPANRAKTSAFGFGKSADGDKVPPSKRKLNLDEEDDTKRKLTKLPTLPDTTDDTPYADQDDEDDDDEEGNFAGNEEEAAAAARALQERRLQQENEEKQNHDDEVMKDADTAAPDEAVPQADAGHASNGVTEAEPGPPAESGQPAASGQPTEPGQPTESSQPAEPGQPAEPMAVDEEDQDEEEADPLDAFMADLADKPGDWSKKSKVASQPQEPEAYFSEEEYGSEAEVEDEDAKKLLAIANKRKKKELPKIDYTKVEVKTVRKNFWAEPAELNHLTEEDVTDLRLELDGIKVGGTNVPKPVQKWAHCGLSRATLDVIGAMGFEKPTPIQMQAIPTLMSGRDVIGVAKTGSGKTMAFLLPMFRHIKDQPGLKDMDGPIGLIMAPTRELAVQIHRDCKPFLKTMGLRAVCGYGGAPIKDQIAELKRGAEVLVCTPGRLIDLLTANQGRVTNLRRATYIVMDEADRMFDMGFEPQIMKIFSIMRPDRQTILFSATMPRIVDSLIKKVLKSPVEIIVGGRSRVGKDIEQIVEVREESTKFLRTLELLGELYDADEDARSLIFVDRQERADDVLKELMGKGYPCMSLHGGKDQVDRDSTILDFKRGVTPILVATSVAARGLDVKQLKLVINYDAPNHLEDYVHRTGRTGRAGNKGVAVTYVTPNQENCAPGICKALEQSEVPVPVPEQLNQMRKSYYDNVKAGKAYYNTGFGGKGLDRLDKEREAARNRERKLHKADGEEDDEKEEKKDKDDEDKHQRALNAIKQAASSVHARQEAEIEFKMSAVKPGREGEQPQPGQQPGQQPGGGGDKGGKNPLDKVSSAVSAINSRLGKAGQLRAGQPIDNKGPDAGAFHATLEINDFPQKARWAVTNRTNVAKILEATGVSITTKGNFYPLGKEVPPNAEPKLYILIEGDTEVVVSSALTEMTRLLREATIAAADADSRAPASGRYTINM